MNHIKTQAKASDTCTGVMEVNPNPSRVFTTGKLSRTSRLSQLFLLIFEPFEQPAIALEKANEN